MCVGYLVQCTGKIVWLLWQQKKSWEHENLQRIITVRKGNPPVLEEPSPTLRSEWSHWLSRLMMALNVQQTVCMLTRPRRWTTHEHTCSLSVAPRGAPQQRVCVTTSSWPAAESKPGPFPLLLFVGICEWSAFWHLDAIVEEPWNSKHSFWCFAACISHGASMCMNAHDASPLFSVAAGWLTSTALWRAEDHGEGLSFIFSPPDGITATSE